MKKKIILGGFLISINAFGLGGVNILTTPTTSGMGNPVQQAEVSVDSVFYNPAALSFLEEGSHFGIGMAISKPDYKQTIRGPGGHKSSEVTVTNNQYLLNGQYIYLKDKRAYYIGIGSMGQGGFLDAPTSGQATSNTELDYLAPGVVFGVSQRVTDKLSLSIGGRYTYVYQEVKYDSGLPNGTSPDLELKGSGIAPEIGIYYRVTPKIDLSAKYLFRTKIDQRASGSPQVAVDSAPSRNDYPAVLTTGTSYKINDKNKVYLGYNYIFEDTKYVYGAGDEKEKYGDTKEYMIGYKIILNEKFSINLGYTYVDRGSNGDPKSIQELDAQVYGVSLEFQQNDSTKYTIALSRNDYDSYNSSTMDSQRRETNVGIAISKKI